MTAGSARFQGEHLIKRPSLRSRMIEWVLWRLRVKGRFAKTDGFRERVVKSRPTDPRPPRSFYRRYRVHETTQAGKLIFTISPRNREARKHLLYLHGGAYVYEIMCMQWRMLARFLDEAMRPLRFLSIHWHRNIRANKSLSLSWASTACFRTTASQSSFLATVLAAGWRSPSVSSYAMPGRRSQPNSCSYHLGSMSPAPIRFKQYWTDPIPFSLCLA